MANRMQNVEIEVSFMDYDVFDPWSLEEMEDQVCSIIGRFSGSEMSRKTCRIIISCVLEYGPIHEISEIFEAFETLIGFETHRCDTTVPKRKI